ncbi:hypothetical protein EIQ06_05335 [Xanthomonas campestris pv. campestris]
MNGATRNEGLECLRNPGRISAACSGYRLRKRAYVGTCRSRAPGCSGCKQPRDAHVPSYQTTP